MSRYCAIFLFWLSVLSVCADEGLVQTISYQGYLQSQETGAPENNIFSMHFFIHPTGDLPPFDSDDDNIWSEFYEKVNVKDGVFFQRLGVYNPLYKGLFRTDSPKELTIKIVPFGTNTAASYLGPMSIDGNSYSVSSIAKKGIDTKEGTLKIIPFKGPGTPDSVNALLEVYTPNSDETHNVEIKWTRTTSVPEANIGKGLIIDYPPDITFFDYVPTPPGAFTPWNEPLIEGNDSVEDIAVYIENGNIKLGGSLTIKPLKLGARTVPGDLQAAKANVTGNIRVNDLITSGTIRGPKLEYCDPKFEDCISDSSKYADYLIDLYPARFDDKPSLINALEVGSKNVAFDGSVADLFKGELTIEGPLQTSVPAYIKVSGSNGAVYTPKVRSPYPSLDRSIDYQISPGGLTVLDGLILATNTRLSPDPDNIDYSETIDENSALKVPLNAYSLFDLLSTVPVCQKTNKATGKLQWYMALRKDYCDANEGINSKDKYATIDPCFGIANNQLKGYRLLCEKSLLSDHPNLVTNPSNPSLGIKYFATNHVHRLFENATAEMLVDIINASSPSKTLDKKLMPVDAVNLTIANTLTGVNVFQDVWAAHRAVASQDNEINAYIGSEYLQATVPAELGSLNTDVQSIEFIHETSSGISGLNLFVGDSEFDSKVLVNKHLISRGELRVEKEPIERTGGNLRFEYNVDLRPPYFYMPGETDIFGSIYFPLTVVDPSRRVISGMTSISAEQYVEIVDPGFFMLPRGESVFQDLTVAGALEIDQQTTVTDSASFSGTVSSSNKLIARNSYVQATRFSDIDNPNFYVEPTDWSYINQLQIENYLLVEGDLEMQNNLDINGTLNVLENFTTDRNLVLNNTEASVFTQEIIDFTQPQYKINPSGSSYFNNLVLDNGATGLGGDLSVDGNVNLTNAITHDGNSTIQGYTEIKSWTQARKLVDSDQTNYYADPNGDTNLNKIHLTDAWEASVSVQMSGNLTVLGDVHSDSTLTAKGNVNVEDDYEWRDGLRLISGGQTKFQVDIDGNISATSLKVSSDLNIENLDIKGDMEVSGGNLNFNAETIMDNLTIQDSSLVSIRLTTQQTVINLDNNGHMQVSNDVNYAKELVFAEKVEITNTADTLVISDQSNSITTINVGFNRHKDVLISGLEANQLSFTTGTFSNFLDSDNAIEKYVDPSNSSVIQTLQISSSLYVENILTAPYAKDIENDYILDPDGNSHMTSLEVIRAVTAEEIFLSKIFIDATNLNFGTTVLDADSFQITKSGTVSFTGITTFTNSVIHLNQSSGLRISDSSAGSGILMTPGDLDVLINNKNADYLHTHDLFGGVELYNLARRDINNSIPNDPVETKGLHGQHLFTGNGLILSVRPELPQTQYPLFSVYSDATDPSAGSLLMGAFTSGTVLAQTFKGSGAAVSNIAGSATTYSAINTGSIDTDKVMSLSLGSEVFQSGSIINRHIPGLTLNSAHIQNSTFSSLSLSNSGIKGEDIADQSILGDFIQNGEIDGTLLVDESIKKYHLVTDSISSDKIQPKTLIYRVFANQAITSNKIVNQSILTTHVSTGAIDTSKIIIDSLETDNFDSYIISTNKIQNNAVQNSELSELATQTLTNSDFASNAITSSKILDLTILESNISTNTLSSTALANDSIDTTKIISFTILAEDIANSTITSNTASAQHKIRDRAITSPKIEDRNIVGSKIALNNLTASHIESNQVTSLQFAPNSIEYEDILTHTLSGAKIRNLSITADMLDNASILARSIANNAFETNSIAINTLSSASFADASITEAKVANNTVGSTNIVNLSLLDEDFAPNSLIADKWLLSTITTSKISDSAITLAKFATSAIISSKVSDHSISTAAIQPGAILTEHWFFGAITESKLAADAVTEGNMADLQINARITAPNSILSSNITDLSVSADDIPNNEITESKIADDAVTADMIKDTQLSEVKFAGLTLVSSDFNMGSVTNIHIDLDTVSSRVIGTSQVLTTHIIDLAITNSLVANGQIDTRILFDGAINASLIESYSLYAADFGSNILTDSQFQANSITDGKIKTNSIAENLWITNGLYGYHVVPLTITSASINDRVITSSQIKSNTISGFHIATGSITDFDLASDALINRVFASRVITTGQIVNESLTSADFANYSLLTTHYDDRIFQNDDLSEGSILTTHILDFTLRSDKISSDQITAAKIDDRSNIARGFNIISKAPNLTDPSQIIELASGKILIFADSDGIFSLENANDPILQKVSSLTGGFGKAMTRAKKVWVAIGSKLYGSAYEGSYMQELDDFGDSIKDFYFEDEFHGILATNTEVYFSYDGGQSFRLVKSDSDFEKVFSISDLEHSWAIKSNGATLYSTDEYANQEIINLSVGGAISANFTFFMKNSAEGVFLEDSTLISTTNNWVSSSTVSQINSPFFFSDSSGNNIFITTAGLSRYTTWSNLNLFSEKNFSEYSAPNLETVAAHIRTTSSWVLLYKHNNKNDYFVAHTSNQGSSYNIVSLGTVDSNLSKYSRLNTYNGNNIYLTRGNHSLKSSDAGINWSSQNLQTPLSHAYDIFYLDALKGFAAFQAPDANQQAIYKTTDGGSNWSLTNQSITTAHLLVAKTDQIVFSAQLGGSQLWASNDAFDTKTSTSFGGAVIEDLQLLTGMVYFAGSNGLVGKVSSADLSDLATFEAVSGVTLTAITTVDGSILLGDSAGKLYLATSFGTTAAELTAFSATSKIYDVCARDSNEFLSVGKGSDTQVSYDGGSTWDQVLDPEYDSTLFSSCIWKSDGTLILGAGNDIMLITKHGEGIEAMRVAENQIVDSKLESGFNASHLISDSIANDKFSADSINGSKILSYTLIESKIASDAVSSAELLASAVTLRSINDHAITNAKIGSETIDGASKIGSDVLTGGDFSSEDGLQGIDYLLIQTDSIDSRVFSQNATSQLTQADFASGAILTENLDHFSFTGDLINNSALDQSKILDGNISGFNIKSGELGSTKVASGSFKVNQIVNFALKSQHISNGSIVTAALASKDFWSDQIKNNELGEQTLNDLSFEAEQFKGRIFSGSLIENNSLDFQVLVDESIRASQIKTNSIEGEDFIANSIIPDKIESGAIDNSLISSGAVIGDFILDGDIQSSKIPSQAISGVLIKTYAISSDRLQTNTFQGIDFAKQVITKSKIATRTLTDGHFENLTESTFATSSIDRKGVRLYQSDSNTVKVIGAYTAVKNLNNHSQSDQLEHVRFSPDGSKVAFISNGNIFWADRTFTRIRDTGIAYSGTTQPFLIWSNNNRIIYHFNESDNYIYKLDIMDGTNLQDYDVNNDGGNKLVFNPDNRSQWAKIDASGNLTTEDSNCNDDSKQFSELEISQSGARLFVALKGSNDIGYCDYGNSFNYNSTLDSDGISIKAHPLSSDRLIYFQGNDLWQTEIPFANARKILTANLTGSNDISRAWIYSGHILQDEAITNENLSNNIIVSSHLADLSIIPESFGGAVIVSDHIQTDAVLATHINATTLNESVLANAVITQGNLVDLTLEGKYFTQDSISASRILSEDIRSVKIADAAIAKSELDVQIISESKVSSKNVLTTHMISEVVSDSAMIANTIIDGSFIASKEVSAFHIQNGAIDSIRIKNAEIYPRALNTGSITESKIVTNSLLGEDFANSVIEITKLESNAFDRGDGFIVTIESGDVRKYNWDGSNVTTLNSSKTWSGLRRIVHGSKLSLYAEDESYEMSIQDGSLSNNEYRPTSARSILSTTDNLAYVMGGDSWIKVSDSGSTFANGAYAVANSKLYLFGGNNGSIQASVREFNPFTRSWNNKSSMPAGGRSNLAAIELAGLIYVIGGMNATETLKRVEVYDPVDDSWSTVADLPIALHDISAATINGRIYIFGGNDGTNNVATTYEYNPGSNSWSTRANMPGGVRSATAAEVHNNKAYVIGGNPTTDRVEEYDATSNSWSVKTSMPTDRSGISAVNLNGEIYVAGGFDGTSYLATLEKYDPTADSWSGSLDTIATAVSKAAMVTIDGLIYHIGGTNGNAIDQVQIYFEGSNNDLWIYEDGAPKTRIDTGVVISAGIDYSPITNKLVYVTQLSSNNLIRVYDGSTVSTEYNAGSDSVTKPVFDRNGSKLFFIKSNTIQKKAIGGAVSQLVDVGQTITDLRASHEVDKVYYIAGGDLYSYENSSKLLINAANTISEFEIIPYSMFDEGEIDDRLASGVFDSKHIASRLFDELSFTDGTLDEDELVNSVITGAVLTNDAITSSEYAGSVNATKIGSEVITGAKIVNGSIQNIKIQTGGLKTRSIATNSLTSNRLSGQINGSKIKDFAISGLHFESGTIEESKIETASVIQSKLESSQISSRNILDYTLLTTNFTNDGVNASVIADLSVTNGNIQTNQLTSSKIQANTLTDSVFASNSVTYGHIKTSQINNTKLADNTLQNDNFYFSDIQGSKLANSTLLESMLANDGIKGEDFAGNIASSKLQTSSLKSADFKSNSISSDKFGSATVPGSAFGDGILNSSKIASNALTAGNVATDTISGSQLSNSAITTDKIALNTFDSTRFGTIFTDSKIANLGLTNNNFASNALRLTTTDFVEEFADSRTVNDSAIQTDTIALSPVIKNDSLGLKLSDNAIVQILLADNSLTGELFATGAITANDIDDNSLSTSKIESYTLTEDKINGVLASDDLADRALIQLNIADGAIDSSKLKEGSFSEDDIYQIGGDEISGLSGLKLKQDAIQSGVLSSLTSREIGVLQANNLKDSIFSSDYFENDGITVDSIDQSSKLSQGKFDGNIPSSKIKLNQITLSKLDLNDTKLNKIFGDINADSVHTHTPLSQTFNVCTTGYTLIGGDSHEAFCISGTQSSQTVSEHKTSAHNIIITGSSLRGSICSMQQLIRAIKEGATISTNTFSSSFTIQTRGFGANLRLLKQNNLDTDGAGNLVISAFNDDQDVRYCY